MLLGAVKVANWAIRRAQSVEQARTRSIEDAYAAAKEDWRLERERQIEVRLRQLEETAANEDALRALLTEEFFFLQANIEIEAFREAMKERRRMLAFAAAGMFSLDLPIPVLARVERVIRELAPEDVKLLARINGIPAGERTERGGRGPSRAHKDRLRILRESDFSGPILQACGCISVMDETVGWAMNRWCEVTKLGAAVLTVLDAYLRAGSLPDAGPEL